MSLPSGGVSAVALAVLYALLKPLNWVCFAQLVLDFPSPSVPYPSSSSNARKCFAL